MDTLRDGEWLVADQRGGFAMGTPAGFRTRKYHGFFLGIPSRSEMAFLSDLEIRLNGTSLWPHWYAGEGDPVMSPELGLLRPEFSYDPSPTWVWKLSEGDLGFRVEAGDQGGIRLRFNWVPKLKRGSLKAESAKLEVRPFFAMRGLHQLGGQTWVWETLESQRNSTMVRIVGAEGAEVQARVDGLTWREDPIWHRAFYYFEEKARGYDAQEDLFSSGVLETNFKSAGNCAWMLAEDPRSLKPPFAVQPEVQVPKQRPPVLDFILVEPAGVVAGFPWFGEWGRDTFVSLPGIVASCLKEKGKPSLIEAWAYEVLDRWSLSLTDVGMLPNLIEKEGTHQWESADASLWWSHSLASLWMLSIGLPTLFKGLRESYLGRLGDLIHSIRSGRHLFLKETELGLLEVTHPHTTWMDARVNGQSVTPRVGVMPEINALWYQARVLHTLWLGESWKDLDELGRLALQICEPDRPNFVFLHSIPLAPSFVLNDAGTLGRDLEELNCDFLTPVGLRTLRPGAPGFISQCVGNQDERDRAYHQGSPWAWLGGHYKMAVARSKHAVGAPKTEFQFPRPIPGHIPEMFDAFLPFVSRGAPAQAWSLACLEEADGRERMGLDSKLFAHLEKIAMKFTAQSQSGVQLRSSSTSFSRNTHFRNAPGSPAGSKMDKQ